jgi:uncharacterized membrane protein (UPF0136 family)
MAAGQIILGAYGLLLLAGGLMGFAKGGSRVSLYAGGITGGLCLGAVWLSVDHPGEGYTIGALVAFLLTGVFINRFRKTKKAMPAGMLMLLSLAVGLSLMMILRDLEAAATGVPV